MRCLTATAATATILACSPAAAQKAQPWPTLFVSAPVAPGWVVSGELVNRVQSDDAYPSQAEARAQLGRVFGPSVTAWIGYVHVDTFNPNARNGEENQVVEQLNWTVGEIAGIRLGSRTRLEQRFQRFADHVNVRLREQVRASLPLQGGTSLVLWTEPYVNLNRTSLVRQTFDQWRNFAGVDFRVTPQLDVEIGYLNQHLNRPRGVTTIHAVPIVFNVRF